MKNTKNKYAAYIIDVSNCYTYDDIVTATVEGNIKNGTPVDRHMFAQYLDIIEDNHISTILKVIRKVTDDVERTVKITMPEVEPYNLSKNEYLVYDNGKVTKKKKSIFVRLYNFLKGNK